MKIESIRSHLNRREEIFNLLSQLTSALPFEQERFDKIIQFLPENHQIYLYIQDNKVVGMITLFKEQKLIHNGACVAHIEDLVVDKNYKNQGIAKKLINYCLSLIKSDTCYKIILNCNKDLISFYEKFEFEQHNVQMSKYFSDK